VAIRGESARYDPSMQLVPESDWPSLAGQYRGQMVEAGQRLGAGDFEAAAAGYERSYVALLNAQPGGRRYHKGGRCTADGFLTR
jgi:hypothetical protein